MMSANNENRVDDDDGDTQQTHWQLGEDVRSLRRLQQDESWKHAVADGRAHISHREANRLHAHEFQEAILQYCQVQTLAYCCNEKSSRLSRLNRELIEHIVHFMLSFQHAVLMRSSGQRLDLCSALMSTLPLHEFEPQMHQYSYPSWSQNFRICVRKRPLNDYEQKERVYDSIHVDASKLFLTAHDGKQARTGRRIHMDHRHFFFDRVWDEHTSNEVVCQSEIDRLISWARAGLNATLLCFGQTGTGKTYTLNAALNFIVKSLVHSPFEVTFVEIHGKKCYDLISNRKVVYLRADSDDNVHIRGARALRTDGSISSMCDVLKQLLASLALRSCEVTERNPISSRSHAICTIRILNPSHRDTHNKTKGMENQSSTTRSDDGGIDMGDEKENSYLESLNEESGAYLGKLMLVDLAGSERNQDTQQMTRAQHRESAEINSSLMALKGCFRAYQMQLHQKRLAAKPAAPNSNANWFCGPANTVSSRVDSVDESPNLTPMKSPYRASLLTRILKECFAEDDSHRTLIIATVSPSSVDLMHSVNTLQHVLKMSPRLSSYCSEDSIEVFVRGAAPRDLPISAWSSEHLVNWLAYTEGGRFAQLVLPAGMTGQQLLGLSVPGLSGLFEGQLRVARRDEEGVAWVEEAEANRGSRALGSLLWRALRREDQAISLIRAQAAAAATSNNNAPFRR